MSLRINTNVSALNAYNNLNKVSKQTETSLTKLSSGYRINSAADDAAGLSISEKMRGQIGGLNQAMRNISDGVSMIQTAEGSLTEVHSMLQRVRDLAVQYKNSTNSTADRTAIQSEVNQLASEIERIGASAKFNGISLLSAGAAGGASAVTFQVGAEDSQEISVALISVGSTVGTSFYSLTATGTSDISEIDAAINSISAARATFGAVQNRLEYTYNAQSAYAENLTAAESRIRDVDMAAEMVKFTKNQILSQAANSMLAQANQAPQGVLRLLG
ncbi:flagellin FliC [Svornostia abyssi]|uniref:Flagellin n=1 Tax=Svornostia abyssi TaxID=2898438 RepID=A0ABY5PJS8_9ACTN|nr:flagellin FliC [Parviterribacteraceae bacterium J379]